MFYYFGLMIEGSGSIPQNLKLVDPDPGGPKTYGSDKSGSRSVTKLNRMVNGEVAYTQELKFGADSPSPSSKSH